MNTPGLHSLFLTYVKILKLCMNLLLVFGTERWSVDMLVWLRQYWKLRQNFNFLSPVLQSFWSYFKQGNTDLNMWLQNSFWRLWRVDSGIIIFFFYCIWLEMPRDSFFLFLRGHLWKMFSEFFEGWLIFLWTFMRFSTECNNWLLLFLYRAALFVK